MNLSQISPFPLNHREKFVESAYINYKVISDERQIIDQVIIDSEFGMDKVILSGIGIKSLFALISNSLDKKYTVGCLANIRLLDKDLRISIRNMYSEFPDELHETLNTIFAVVEKVLPIFSEIIPQLIENLQEIGNQQGLNYLKQASTKTTESKKEKPFLSYGKTPTDFLKWHEENTKQFYNANPELKKDLKGCDTYTEYLFVHGGARNGRSLEASKRYGLDPDEN